KFGARACRNGIGVMGSPLERSPSVSATATMALPAQSQAPTSFEALYRARASALYAYVASLLRDQAAAEDVTAQTFERALRKRRTFNAKRGTERAWLFGIA